MMAHALQRVILNLQARPLTAVADVKAGVLSNCVIFPANVAIKGKKVVGYDLAFTLRELARMRAEHLVTEQEFSECLKAVQAVGASPSIDDWLMLSATWRYSVVRWTPAQIVAGFQMTRAGKLLLVDCFAQPALIKVDAVAWLDSAQKYVDFSVIYSCFYYGGKAPMNDLSGVDVRASIALDCVRYLLKSSSVKALKRCLSISRVTRKAKDEALLTEFLNGPVGLLYNVQSDLGTVQWCLENFGAHAVGRLETEMDGVKGRLVRCYPIAVEIEPKALNLIEEACRVKPTRAGVKRMLSLVEKIEALFKPVLDKAGIDWMRAHKFLPLRAPYAP